MQKKPLISRGVRLHPALWEQIEHQAHRERRTPTDYLRLQIESLFRFDHEVHEMHEKGAE